ncbi:D-tyrosyl-tRNA(Tyr) deacylase [bacterium]|nr:D-tyrosyl-tRNA(Tyr) deacylase [bacterium]
MKLVIQRVTRARLTAENGKRAEIGKGFVVLAGACEGDSPDDVLYLAGKLAKLRICEDDAGKMNLSINNSGGEILLVSQFTLFANTRKGNRPSFNDAARPEIAEPLIILLADELKKLGVKVITGVFGAHMDIEMVCDGPVTILIDSDERHIPRRKA